MTNVLHKMGSCYSRKNIGIFCYLLYYTVHCYISQMLLWYCWVLIILYITENVCNFSCFPGNNCKCTNSPDCSTPPAADVRHRRGTCATQLHTCQTRRTLRLITHILVPQRPFVWWSEGSVNLVSYQDTGGEKISPTYALVLINKENGEAQREIMWLEQKQHILCWKSQD